MSVGQQINQYLKEHGITQTWLSNKTGISLPKLNLSLNGNRRMTFDDYSVICWALDVPTGSFIQAQPPRFCQTDGVAGEGGEIL